MICKNCGEEIPENETKCQKCGTENAQIQSENGTEITVKPRGFSSKKNILIIVLAGVLALGGGTAAAVIGISKSASQSVSNGIKLAERYLSEQNYEQAVIEYEKVLEIEPKNVEAYLGLAKAYLGMGDKEKALEALREGLEITGDKRLQDKIDELTKPVESSSAPENSSSKPEESQPEESKPEFGSMGTATVAGTELDIATTERLFIINKKLSDAGHWHYADFENYEKHFDSVIYLNEDLSKDDLNELSRLSNLEILDISYTNISDISFLANYKNLVQLFLRSNPISDITPISSLTNLSSLDLSFNQISDISPLASLTNLTSLGLIDNQISDADIAWIKEKLPKCEIKF